MLLKHHRITDGFQCVYFLNYGFGLYLLFTFYWIFGIYCGHYNCWNS